MRLVYKREELEESIEKLHVKKKLFGDDSLIIEEYIEKSHHVGYKLLAISQGK